MDDNTKSQSFANLSRSKKTAVIFLSTVAIAILATWFWQFNTRLNKPFNPDPEPIDLASKNSQTNTLSDKVKDTDKDGLSDFDETNTYQTSPYIEDTDGDGTNDGQEVSLGKDPLCAEGKDCSSGSLLATTTVEVAELNNKATSTVDEALIIKALSGQGDPASLRELLIQGGANKDELDQISDDDLMTSYREVLKSQNPAALTATSSASVSTTTPISQ